MAAPAAAAAAPLGDAPTAAQALALLQKTDAAGGGSLYEQLVELVGTVLEAKPEAPVDLTEMAKLQRAGGVAPLAAAVAATAGGVAPEPSAADVARGIATCRLFGNADVPIDGDSGEPVPLQAPNDYECEDVLGDAALFDALGVGLGRAEALRVALAVKALGEDPQRGVATVRFFGKFFGTHGDYYVYEATLKRAPPEPEQQQGSGGGGGEQEEEEEEELMMLAAAAAGGGGAAPPQRVPPEWNSGANAYVYFVAAHPGGPLTQLPHVTPAQVKAARAIKRFLTGRLSSPVSAYPLFPGTEANYLRAQIARISCTTVACPAGLFVVNDDGGLEAAEDYAPLPAREMGSAANWAHRYPHLKRQGRCVPHRREPPEGADEDAFEWTEEELEEGPEPLAPLEDDAEVPAVAAAAAAAGAGGGGGDGAAGAAVGGTPAWSPLFSSSGEHVKNQVAGLRSNLWPGAVCACQGSRFTNVYVGWGAKAGPFVPLPPPPVASEVDAALVESSELPARPMPAADGGDDAHEGGGGGGDA